MSTTRVLIIYGSIYGYTQKYADWLAEDLRALPQEPDVETVPAAEVTPEQAEAAEIVIIGGSDYGGFLTGAPALRKKIVPLLLPKRDRTAFFTVSFTGEYSKEPLDKAVAKSYTANLTANRPIMHLRGGIQWSELSLTHKAALKGPVRAWLAAKSNPNEGIQQMLDCYGTEGADYSDRNTLKPLVHEVSKIIGDATSKTLS